MKEEIQIKAEFVNDDGTGSPGVDCWIGDESRTISIDDALCQNEFSAVKDISGYDRHGASLWAAVHREMAHIADFLALRAENQALKKQLEHERSEREAAQRTIARLGGGES